jgi:hypothetical protein
MVPAFPKRLPAVIGVILVIALCGLAEAAVENTITEVSVAPDLRRVIIKCSDPVGQYNTFRLDRPPRLVIDVAGARPGRDLKSNRPEQNGGLKVQVAESRTGAHVVLDFGGAPVPELRIRSIGTYLIVFMDRWEIPKKAPSQASPEKTASHKPASESPKAVAKPRPRESSGRSDLMIKSARVVDGLIVLTVADRQHPEHVYRIDLGVNFQQMGFVSAGIYPLQAPPDGLPPGESTVSAGPGAPSAAPAKIGPRRQVPQEMLQGDKAQIGSFEKAEQAGTASNRAAVGPRRLPEPTRGPVSLRIKNIHDGRSVNEFPHVSVTELARAKLFAYRQNPWLRSQTCGIVPKQESEKLHLAHNEP